jgi:hypothetical protein
MRIVVFVMAVMTVVSAPLVHAQGLSADGGTISGSIQMDAATYSPDSLIGAPNVPERFLSNTFANLLYTRGKLTLGVRFESYQNPLLGIDPRYGTTGAGTGIGLPYRFATYADDVVDITVGNFYEQFGSGMILRTYEERNLGFDNSIDGIRAKFMPVNGLKITGFVGRQRTFFQLSEGILRGADATADLGRIDSSLLPEGMRVELGASLVSRYQADLDGSLRLPENVMASSGRASVQYNDFTLDLEYAYKVNDPGEANALSYNPGNAMFAAFGYAASGIGVNLAAKRIDNMDFRSNRTAVGNDQFINYMPALTKQHTWRLITLYPYATQPTGEFGLQAEVVFTIPKGTFLGDDETTVSVNYSSAHGLDTVETAFYRYAAEFMWSSNPRDMYFRDVNVEITRKWGRSFKTTFSWINLEYNQDVVERLAAPRELKYGIIGANFMVLELWWAVKRGQALRTEFQYMTTTYEPGTRRTLQNGDWVMALAEYSVSPSWFFTVFGELNYNRRNETNTADVDAVVYPNFNVAYVHHALRLQGGFARVRGGILCVGGICRPVPASNGFTLGMTYTF